MSDRDDETGEVCCSCGDYIYIEKMCMCEEIALLRARVEELESLIARVADELSDPMSENWCDKPKEDRQLLESLLDHVVDEMGLEGDDD